MLLHKTALSVSCEHVVCQLIVQLSIPGPRGGNHTVRVQLVSLVTYTDSHLHSPHL